MKVMENEIRGKKVMSSEGLYLGIIRNINVDEKTGKLVDLIVEPSDKIDPRLYNQNDEGYLIFPFDSVKSVKDVVVLGEE
ncbi:MAG: PRC-barrel domain protein [Thermoplasmata archaeon]|nr:MAG: PRC-barrel domain protein [Thermoplasmata archaeon]KAA0009516.1 MAG: PRC-barrel domain protein [Thermoplasmata archaeon]MCD6572734.1 PRC-barrel domain-containing protein [Thermoplasmata archaeon]RLB58119.1 MAG: PRC-barrel domain protein [Deltaproteobacteria bacterium]